MTSGARKARHRDDGLKSWTCCWCFCWWWWWWCARGQSSYDHEDHDNDDDAQPIFSARRWRRSLASLLFLSALLSERLGLSMGMGTGSGLGIGTGMGTGTGTGTGSLRSMDDVVFIGNFSCAAKNCLTFVKADHLCEALWGAGVSTSTSGSGSRSESASTWNAADLYLSFCDSYSLMDLLHGAPSPDLANCSVDALRAGGVRRCQHCVETYQHYDVHAQEKYDEFELMTERYVTDAYSVRTCMEECKMVYKPWLCAQFFQSNQSSCSRKVPCERYCLDVQQRCPFILPDNDDLIHGGTPSFICTGLSERTSAEQEPQCCDVRWELRSSNRSRSTFKRTHPSCQHGSSASSGSPRLAQGRLKLCLLVLVLLHTVATITASHNSTCLTGICPLEDNAAQED
ncbi:NALCN channel auxiliary factor 1 [Hoplias malabaricus]|uniref:NALCN channel auxiliary factor 1 n=1 Tax=Hoplias malabaricus TaxID=27720 RepID=UPI003461E920